MVNLVFSIISLVILAPVIYFLPLGYSRKGKITLTSISLLLANLGLLSRSVFPIWQVVLIMILLVIFSSILLDSKWKDLFSYKETTIDHSVHSYIVNEGQKEIEGINGDRTNFIINETLNNTPNQADLEKPSELQEVKMNLVSKAKDVHKEEPHLGENYISRNQENQLAQLTNDRNADLEDDDISFLTNREHLIKDSFEIEENVSHLQAEDSSLYMADIEQMLIEDEIVPIENKQQDQDSILPKMKEEYFEAAASIEEAIKEEKVEIPIVTFEQNNKPIIKDEVQADWDDVIEPIKEFTNK